MSERPSIGLSEESRGLAGRLEHVFEAVRNPKTGEPYTNGEAARMTLASAAMWPTAGSLRAPVLILSTSSSERSPSVFGAEPSYLLDHESSPLLDEELVQALGDADVREITRESSRLPDRQRKLV